MEWEGQETSLKPGEKAWSRTLPLWPEALAGHQPVSWGGVCPELILDSGSLSPGWEGGAHGCPLPGKGALLVIPVPPRMGDGGWGGLKRQYLPQVMALSSLPLTAQTLGTILPPYLRCQALRRSPMRTSMWSVSAVQVKPSLHPGPPCPETLGCPPAAQHSQSSGSIVCPSLSTPATHICLQTHTRTDASGLERPTLCLPRRGPP